MRGASRRRPVVRRRGGGGAVALAMGLVAVTSGGRAAEPLPETPAVLPAEDAVARTLASERYRFCFDAKYPLWEDEQRWCELLPRSPDPHATRCPAFAASCRAGATATLAPREQSKPWRLPDFGGLGRLIFWSLVVAAVAGLVVFIVKVAFRGGGRREKPERADAPVAPRPDTAAAAAAAVIERDVERLMARARAAAAVGDFAAAVSDLRAALLRRLEGDGHVRIHPSATNGDYVRELRHRAPPLAAPVDGVVREAERVEFGDGAGAEMAYQSVLARVGPLLLRSAGKLSALMLAALLSSSCQPPGRPDWSSSPSGSAAVAQFLTAVGMPARERIRELKDLARDSALHGPNTVMVLPDAQMGDAEWTALRDWLTDTSHRLVVAAGSTKLPIWIPTLDVVPTGASGALQATEELLGDPEDQDDQNDADEQQNQGWKGLSALRGRVPGGAWLRMGVETGDVLMSRGERPYAVMVNAEGAGTRVASGAIIVLADASLLTNASLVVADNAALLEALTRLTGGPVEIANAETGLVAANPVAAVTRGRLAPFLLQLGACLIMFLLLRGRAFGRLVDRDETARRAFSEHVRALGTQYARARAGAHVLGSYAAWATDRLRERIRLSGDRGIGDLAGAVAARTGRPLGEVARVLFAARRDGDAAEDAPEDRSRAGAQQQLTMMRELAQMLTATHATSGRPSGAGAVRTTIQKAPTQKGTPTT
jgi:hypothetical protein